MVDVSIYDCVDVCGEFYLCVFEGDYMGRVDFGFVGMEVLFKEYFWWMVKLWDYDLFGIIDYEGIFRCYVRDVFEEYILYDGLEIYMFFVIIR